MPSISVHPDAITSLPDLVESYHANITLAIPDSPPWDPSLATYARYKPFDGEMWAEFKSRIDASMEAARAAVDPELPIWEESKFYAPETVSGSAPGESLIARMFADARGRGPFGAHLLNKLISLAPATRLLPSSGGDPATEDFRWSKMRCLMAGAGYEHHRAIARALADYGCPWNADESEGDWRAAVQEAHRACGWPTTLVRCQGHALRGLPRTPDGTFLPDWLRALAWLHVLAHVRLEDHSGLIRIVYRGLVTRLEPATSSNIIGHQKALVENMLAALGCPPLGTAREGRHPWTLAVSLVFRDLAIDKLDRLKPLALLPPTVFAGRWTTLVAAPCTTESVEDLGVRLEGAWELDGDRVLPAVYEDADVVMGFDWAIADAATPEAGKQRERFAKTLPDPAPVVWPSHLFTAVFPNLILPETGGTADRAKVDPLAVQVLLDLPIFASILRQSGQGPEGLEREFPLLCVLPNETDAEGTTEQGKSAFAGMWARAMTPDARVVRAMDSSSAPDMRAIAEELRNCGTVCLDEWQPPLTRSSLMSRDNLQSLCTGGSVLVGRVMENTTGDVHLLHSICLSAKALDFPPDLCNRSLFMFLRQLTEDEKKSPVFPDIISGKVSMLARLGALRLIAEHDIAGRLARMEYDGSTGFRFGNHGALAQLLYEIRCDAEKVPVVTDGIAKALEWMRRKHEAHTEAADDSGLMVSLVEGRDIRLTLSGLLHDVSPAECERMRDFIRSRSGKLGTTCRGTASMLIRARMSLRGSADAPLCTVIPEITGRTCKMSDRSVAIALGKAIRREIPVGSGKKLDGLAGMAGWYLVRRKDHAGSPMVGLEILAATGSGAVVEIPGAGED
jgi:hypothetical protein